MRSSENAAVRRRSTLQGQQPGFSLRARGRMDIVFFGLIMVLLTVGLVMMFSASYAYAYYHFNNSYHFIIRQAEFAVLGVLLMVLISHIDYHILAKMHLPWILYGVSLVMLVIVLMLPPMQEGFDYKRWFAIGSFSFQPSEIAKFAVILLFSYLISRNYRRMGTFKYGVIPYMCLAGVVCMLVVVEPHLSATLLIFSIALVMMIAGGMKLRWLGIGAGVIGVGGAAAILTGIVDYGGDRIKYWLDPWASASDKGYQTIQSLLAIGSGGFWGRGLGQSRQKFLWVPEPHNDFIFAIVCEELGLVGAVCVIALFGLVIWRGILIAMRAPDKFGALLAIGITLQIGLQAVLNIFVVTNTVPNTGISLPFFSYGGTSLVMLLCQIGVVLSISRFSTVKKT